MDIINRGQLRPNLCLRRIVVVLALCSITPTLVAQGLIFPGSTWTVASPESQGIDSDLLEANLDAISNRGNIVVVRYGRLVYDSGAESTPIKLYSVSKSLTALIYARAEFLGQVAMQDSVPNSDFPSGPRATYQNFLTMTSAFGHDPREPGNHYAYNNDAVQHYGHELAQTVFSSTDADAVDRALFDHIGREDAVGFQGWMSGWNGGGWELSARDLARVGLLLLANGNWDGTRILPDAFVQVLYENQIPPTADPSPDTDIYVSYNEIPFTNQLQDNYSYGWWVAHNLFGSCMAPEVLMASGYKGNKLFIVPDDGIVIAVTNTVEDDPFDPDRHCAYVNGVLDAIVVPLPVELVAFDAVTYESEVTLTWTTASELDNAGFEIQHRVASDPVGARYIVPLPSDDDTWQSMAFVGGHGATTEARTYQYTVSGLAPGTHWVRLKQVDFGGEVHYTAPLRVSVEIPANAVVAEAYPNPFHSTTTLDLVVGESGHTEVELFDVLGRSVEVLFRGALDAQVRKRIDIDGSRLPGGRYWIRIQTPDQQRIVPLTRITGF